MKRIFTAALLLALAGTSAHAQSVDGNYDLQFEFGFPADTLDLSKPFSLTSKVYNLGPEAYPGGTIVFAYTVQSPDFGSNLPANPHTLKMQVPALPVNASSAGVIQNFRVKTDPNRLVNGKNIVIVWPTGDFIDNNEDNNTYEGTIFTKNGVHKVGISAEGKKDLRVNAYPNPANNVLYFEWPAYGFGSAELTDVSGKVITAISLNTTPMGERIALNTENIPDGIYILTVKADNQVYRQRLTVSHPR